MGFKEIDKKITEVCQPEHANINRMIYDTFGIFEYSHLGGFIHELIRQALYSQLEKDNGQ